MQPYGWVFLALLAAASSACGAETIDIAPRLRAADAEVLQGTVRYWRVGRKNSTPRDLEKEMKQLRIELRKDTRSRVPAREREMSLERDIEAHNDSIETSWTEVLRYSKDMKIVHVQHDEDNPMFNLRTVYDGRVNLTFARGDTLVNAGEPAQLTPSTARTSLYPGPCYILGRGLSDLERITCWRDEDRLVVSGYTSGWHVRALIDEAHGWIAKRIDLESEHDVTVTRCWLLKSPKRSVDGKWVPSDCKLTASSGGVLQYSVHFTLNSADFSEPDAASFRTTLPPDRRTIDARLDHQVVYDKLPSGVATAQDLLPYTKKEVDGILIEEAQDAARHRNEDLRRWVRFSLQALFAVALLVCARLFIRARRGSFTP